MGLIKCRDCGKEISDSAPQCIHCGSLNTRIGNQEREVKKLLEVWVFLQAL